MREAKLRIIKYKIWYPDSRLMQGPFDIDIFYRQNSVHPHFAKSENHHYLQLTGFKDSAGKFIYEADILKIDDHLYKVYWHEDNNWAIKGIHGAVDADMTRGIIENDSIVMGNIYEHPELLEKSE